MVARVAWSRPLVAGLVAVSAWGLAAPAVATTDDPHWYFSDFGYAAIHDSGVTGAGVTVAVIDGPINPDLPTLQGADVQVQESLCLDETGSPRPGVTDDVTLGEHGSNIVSYIAGTGAGYEGQEGVRGVAPGATVLAYAVYLGDEGGCYNADGGDPLRDGYDIAVGQSMAAAVEAGADIISVSLIAGANDVVNDAMIAAMRAGVVVVAGLANLDDAGVDGAPAILNGAVSVLSAQRSGDLSLGTGGTVNDSPYVVVVGPGSDIVSQGDNGDWTQQSTRSGTSIATPIVAGNLALVLSKYEGATGNQAIQSLIRHTGGTPHELMWDPLYGYGLVVPDTLVAADPREYPDVNPLIDDPNTVDTLPRLPLAEEIFPEGNVSPSGNPTSDPGPPSDPGGAAGSAWMLVAVVGGLILLLLVIVIVVVAISASKKNKV